MKSPEIVINEHHLNKIVIMQWGPLPTQHYVYYRRNNNNDGIRHLRRDGVWCQVGNQSVGEFFFDDYGHAERFALNNPNFGPWHPKFQELALPPRDATND